MFGGCGTSVFGVQIGGNSLECFLEQAGAVLQLFWWVPFVLVIFWIIIARALRGTHKDKKTSVPSPASSGISPMAALKARLVSGEITLEEFETIKQALLKVPE